MELSVYLGRMPILDAKGKVIAYELLHRSTEANHTTVADNVQATARVLVNAFNYIGLRTLTDNKPAFIKVNDTMLLDDLIFSISEKHFVLEILESSLVSSELIQRVQKLHKKGYRFALNHYKSEDDFILHFKALLPFVSYIKIDIRNSARVKILAALEELSALDAHFIAEKVEDMEDFEWAKTAGFNYFQGYYFSKPQIYVRETVDPDSKTLLELIYLLKRESPLEEIITVFNDSPYLSINLLKFIHLHEGSGAEKIASIDQALLLLGREKLSFWIELMIYAQEKKDEKDEEKIASPLGKIARQRAYLMEELAHLISQTHEQRLSISAYLVGILSLAEAIFQSSFEQLFEQMGLEHAITEALIDKKGKLGELLKLSIAVERNDFDEINILLERLVLTQEQLNKAMIQSYKRASFH
jgi:EAL and modified HD-GYP domain-containing signal transduction protein